MHPAFEAAFNARNLDSLLDLYEDEAVVVGHAAIREALTGFLGLNGPITMTTRTIIPTGDLAMLHAEWVVNGTGPDGAPLTLAARSSEVVRRQADGSWRYIIDNPYSVDATDSA
jgi:ketosteroid isomerase-like protein